MARWLFAGVVLLLITDPISAAPTSVVKHWEVTPTSLVAHGEPALQKIDLAVESEAAIEACVLLVYSAGRLLAEKPLGALKKGANRVSVLLPEVQKAAETRWVLSDASRTLAEKTLTWNPPRHWTLYVLKSAHVDIGLHDSQYRQRALGNDAIDRAQRLADETSAWPDAARYRYAVEGLWWWLNYPQDRSEAKAREVVEKYVRPGIFGIGAAHSGHHPQV